MELTESVLSGVVAIYDTNTGGVAFPRMISHIVLGNPLMGCCGSDFAPLTMAEERSYAFYTGQIIEDTRKKPKITQAESANRNSQ